MSDMTDPFERAEAEKLAKDSAEADRHASQERLLADLHAELSNIRDRLRQHGIVFEWGYRGFKDSDYKWLRSEPTSRCIIISQVKPVFDWPNAITVYESHYYAEGSELDEKVSSVRLGSTPAEAVEAIVRSVIVDRRLPATGSCWSQQRFMNERDFRGSKLVRPGSGCAVPLLFAVGAFGTGVAAVAGHLVY